MIRREQQGIVWYQFARFGSYPELKHGVFTRHGGVSKDQWASLNVSLAVGDEESQVWENRRRLARALGFDLSRVAIAGQVHGARVSRVSSESLNSRGSAHIPGVDGMIAAESGLGLLMTFADCVPVLLYDSRHKAIGLAHAGWRGTVTGVAPATVHNMISQFGSRSEEIVVGIGPSIGPCCYEVGEDVMDAARQALGNMDGLAFRNGAGRWRLDLWEANRRLLVQAGVSSSGIEVAGVCTACHTGEFFSYRGLGGRTGRFGVLVGLSTEYEGEG